MGEQKEFCSKCSTVKDRQEFYDVKKNGVVVRASAWCKACHKKHKSNWHKRNKDKVDAAQQKYRDSGNQWRNALKRLYGITEEQYNEMLQRQGGCCAICRNPQNNHTSKRLHVDHDHSTGVVRGLLCYRCNQGLGSFEENIVLLRLCIEYLEKTR
jgi:Autographiviridae endonuclease VII